jgi:hypothetical protein
MPRPSFVRCATVIALLSSAVTSSPAIARAANEALRWVPDDTRVVLQIDPMRAVQQPKTREALGLDPLLARLAASRLPQDQARTCIIAYVNEGQVARPLAITTSPGSLATAFDKLHGAKVESSGGKSLYASPASKDWVMALVEPNCLIEGPRQTVRAVLEQAAAHGKSLADVPAGQPAQRLLAAPAGSTAPVTLVYLAPGGGSDLFTVLQDLDRILDAEMSATLASYQAPLKMLGPTQGLRLDLQQASGDLQTTLRMAMASPMAAQIASVSLQAGKDMAKSASDAAVSAGKMTADDAGVLASALETMQTQAEGDLVRVSLRVPDGVAQRR